MDFNGNALADGAIDTIVSTPDGSNIAVTICSQAAFCYPSPGGIDPNAMTTTFRSQDGGITWQEIDRRGPAAFAAGIMQDGRVLIANHSNLSTVDYVIVPGGTTAIPPASGAMPIMASDAIVWVTDDGSLLNGDGTTLAQVPRSSERTRLSINGISGTIARGEKSSALVSWSESDDTQSRGYFGVLEDGVFVGEPLVAVFPTQIGSWIPKYNQAVVTVDSPGRLQPLPALLDMQSGQYHLIPNPFDGGPGVGADTGRALVRGTAQGPFAQVKGTGSCLNVRDTPSTDGQVLSCAVDGVLLRESGDVSDGWVSVTTPGGILGWVDASHLRR